MNSGALRAVSAAGGESARDESVGDESAEAEESDEVVAHPDIAHAARTTRTDLENLKIDISTSFFALPINPGLNPTILSGQSWFGAHNFEHDGMSCTIMHNFERNIYLILYLSLIHISEPTRPY